jgi:hypothetical protein
LALALLLVLILALVFVQKQTTESLLKRRDACGAAESY